MDDISEKALLRATVLATRRGLDKDDVAVCSKSMIDPGLRLAQEFHPKLICLYQPIRNEVDPNPLAHQLAKHGYALALPVTNARDAPLFFRHWHIHDHLVKGSMGMAEPAQTSPLCEPDLLFIPLCVFDRRGFRIGYGAGHYDRALQILRAKRPTLAVGMAYAFQEIDHVPSEPHDQPLDCVLTERELILCEGMDEA